MNQYEKIFKESKCIIETNSYARRRGIGWTDTAHPIIRPWWMASAFVCTLIQSVATSQRHVLLCPHICLCVYTKYYTKGTVYSSVKANAVTSGQQFHLNNNCIILYIGHSRNLCLLHTVLY